MHASFDTGLHHLRRRTLEVPCMSFPSTNMLTEQQPYRRSRSNEMTSQISAKKAGQERRRVRRAIDFRFEGCTIL
jgi:hypothetical protein